MPRAHYEQLIARRRDFSVVSETLVTTSGYGFRVAAGQVFRLTLTSGMQVLDVGILGADDPHEHVFTGTQLAIEGGRVGRFTRLWGPPPLSRPMATCIADSVRHVPSHRGTGEHLSHGAHCNPHLWHLYAGHHGRSCYDNLREALAMVGLSQRYIGDNLNLFMEGGIDPYTGATIGDVSDARQGDLLEFYAEIDLIVLVSHCPVGGGSDDLRDSWTPADQMPTMNPITVTLLDTGVEPVGSGSE